MNASRRLRAFLGMIALAAFTVSGTFADVPVRPPNDGVPHVTPMPRPIPLPTFMPRPKPGTTSSPSAAATPAPTATGAQPRATPAPVTNSAGTVPLSKLAPLPPKTPFNTAVFGPRGQGRHPMAASGATIWYFEDTTNAACANAVGSIVPVGCDLYYYSLFLNQSIYSGDTFQDYYISINSQTATSVGSTYTSSGSPSARFTPNLTSGIWVLATYDKTKSVWVVVTYVTVGSLPFMGTFSDSAARVAADQFTAGATVYFQATGLTNNDYYAVYVESTAGAVACETILPAGTSTPNPTGLCDPTSSPGTPALSSPPTYTTPTINLNWTTPSTLASGTYNAVLWDISAGQRVQEVQFSILASTTTASLTLTPVAGNSAISGFYAPPTQPPTPYSATDTFAFDNTSEQSDKGWTLSASGLSASTSYYETITDPQGEVVNQNTGSSSSGGALTWNLNFNNTQTPSNYFTHSYTVELYNRTTHKVDYSQGFSILGYNVATDFANGTSSFVLASGATNVAEGLQFTNDGQNYYGTGNADTISGISLDTGGGQGITATLSGVTPTPTGCTLTCTYTETETDTSGVVWTVVDQCKLNGGSGDCTITATPSTSGNSLAVGATLSIPNVVWNNSAAGHCTSGCVGTTVVEPTHGVMWSNYNQSYATNPIYFTNGGTNPPAGTASVSHYGYVDQFGNVLAAGEISHEYAAPNTHMTYTQSSPWTATSGYGDEWDVHLDNTTAIGGTTVTQVEVELPSSYVASNSTVFVDTNLSPAWSVTTCSGSPPSNAFCFKTSTGLAPQATSDLYLQVYPLPVNSYTYANGAWVVQATSPTVFPFSDGGATFTVFDGSPTTESVLDTAAYSLTASRITPGFNPTSEGYNTNNTVSITMTNATGAGSDPNPDYIDAFTIDLPYHSYTSITLPTGWLESSQDISGTVTRYWFYECAAQFNTSDGPVTAPPPPNPTLPNCGSSTETLYSIAPGSTLTVSGKLSVGTSNVTATMYAHGANGAGWSTSDTFTLTVTSVAASAGFVCAQVIPCTSTNVTSPNSASVGADADTTLGNGFGYTITNNSSGGQNITSAVITVPGQDVSGNTPADGTGSPNTPWTITATPTLTGTTYGCSITGYASATQSGTNGYIDIGGASCSIPPNDTIEVLFTAKAPYTVGKNYQFSTQVNGSVKAAENFPVDTLVAVVLTAQLSVTIDPAPDPTPAGGGSKPTPSCAICTFLPSSDEVDFGAIPINTTTSASDAARVSLYTDAGSTVSWNLYVSANNNPSNNGSAGYPTDELLTSVDQTASLGGQTISGLTFNTTSYTVVPTPVGSTSLTLASSSGLTYARRDPIDFIMNYEISIGASGPTTAETSTLVYTFISN